MSDAALYWDNVINHCCLPWDWSYHWAAEGKSKLLTCSIRIDIKIFSINSSQGQSGDNWCKSTSEQFPCYNISYLTCFLKLNPTSLLPTFQITLYHSIAHIVRRDTTTSTGYIGDTDVYTYILTDWWLPSMLYIAAKIPTSNNAINTFPLLCHSLKTEKKNNMTIIHCINAVIGTIITHLSIAIPVQKNHIISITLSKY